jgi:hypothetical protein
VATSDMTHHLIRAVMPYTIHRTEDLSPSMLTHTVAILQHNALSFMPTYGVVTTDLAYRGDISTPSPARRLASLDGGFYGVFYYE